MVVGTTAASGSFARRGGILAPLAAGCRDAVGGARTLVGDRWFRILGLVLVVLLFALVPVAIVGRLMLNGDGAYFVYVLWLGDPWALKWSLVAARAVVYLTTVLPTSLLAEALALGPLQIAGLNAFFFFLVPALATAAAVALVWRRAPVFVLFPVLHYALAAGLGWGFPSESLFTPGFLWLFLFAVAFHRPPVLLAALLLAAVLFTHEFALPAALTGAAFAVSRAAANGDRRRAALLAAAFAAVVAGFLAVELGGGAAGATSNALFALDVRRLLDNNSAMAMIGVVALTLLATRVGRVGPAALAVGVGLALVLPVVLYALHPGWISEEQRYMAPRSLVGGVGWILALVFVAAASGPATKGGAPGFASRWVVRLAPVTLAFCVGSFVAFLADHRIADRAYAALATGAGEATTPAFVSFDDALAGLPPAEAAAVARHAIPWTLAFRSFVVADGRSPAAVVFDRFQGYPQSCGAEDGTVPVSDARPDAALAAWRAFACRHQPEVRVRDRLSERARRWLRDTAGF